MGARRSARAAARPEACCRAPGADAAAPREGTARPSPRVWPAERRLEGAPAHRRAVAGPGVDVGEALSEGRARLAAAAARKRARARRRVRRFHGGARGSAGAARPRRRRRARAGASRRALGARAPAAAATATR